MSMRSWFLTPFWIVVFAAAPSLEAAPRLHAEAFAPSTRPIGPVEESQATDQPLAMLGADPEMARRLALFDVPAKSFSYTLVPVEKDENRTVFLLRYPSPCQSPFPNNNLVPAELYFPRVQEGEKVPAAIVLDILDGRAIVARSMARSLSGHGVAALYVPLAYFGARRPEPDSRIRFFSADPSRSVDAIRQSVMDIRRAKAILASRPDVSPHEIGITGVSLGGIMTALAAGVDGQFDRVMPILSGGDLAKLVFHTRETRGLAQKLQENGIDREALATMLSPVEPLRFASRIDPVQCLMVNAAFDDVIPRDATLALRVAMAQPTIFWVSSGHYGAVLYLPQIEETAARFLGGKKVDHLGF